jgi:hypothetical protein
MTAGTHDDGRLFGMGADGTIWTEPALSLDTPAHDHAAAIGPVTDPETAGYVDGWCLRCSDPIHKGPDGTWHHD